MKFKYPFIIFLLFLIVFIIYNYNLSKKIYYFNIIDDNYDFKTYNSYLVQDLKPLKKYINYETDDYRVTDLINDIKQNKKVNDIPIQNILIKADIITLTIGKKELIYKFSTNNIKYMFDYINEISADLEELFKTMRIYSKEKIYFIGFKAHDEQYSEIYNYLNIKVADICLRNKITFINLNDKFNALENVNIYKNIKKTVAIK